MIRKLFIFNFFFHQKGRNQQRKTCISIRISCKLQLIFDYRTLIADFELS